MPGTTFGPRKPFLSIVQGTLRQKVEEGAEGATERTYKTKDKNDAEVEATKWELTFLEWSGLTKDIRLKDTPFGEVLELEFDDVVISMGSKSRFFQDFMQKLPNINLNQTFSFHPYDFEADGVKRVGVSITQNGEKIKSYYWNDVDKKSCNGIPTAPKNAKKTYSKDDWELFFGTMRKFLKETLPKYVDTIDSEMSEESLKEVDEVSKDSDFIPTVNDEEEEIKMSDIPF